MTYTYHLAHWFYEINFMALRSANKVISFLVIKDCFLQCASITSDGNFCLARVVVCKKQQVLTL